MYQKIGNTQTERKTAMKMQFQAFKAGFPITAENTPRQFLQ